MSVTLNPQGLDFVQYKLAEKFVVRNLLPEVREDEAGVQHVAIGDINAVSISVARNKERRRWPLIMKLRSPSPSWRRGSGSCTQGWGTSSWLICTRIVRTLSLSTRLSGRGWLWKTIRGEAGLLPSPRAIREVETHVEFIFLLTAFMYLECYIRKYSANWTVTGICGFRCR